MKNKRHHFSPTEDAIFFSKQIADRLDMPFDKEKTRQQSIVLLDLYFQDLSKALPNETGNCNFQNFASRDFTAFIGHIKKIPIINIDQQWSAFLYTANIIVSIQACIIPEKFNSIEMASLFKENLFTIPQPYTHEILREKMRPVFLEHAQVLPLANILTKAMLAFMLCHELAHYNLGHLEKPEEKQHELDADTLGFDYFAAVSKVFEQLNYLKIPPNMICAPIIAMMYLRALEIVGIVPEETDTHPSSTQRIENLYEKFNHVAKDDARYLHNGLKLSCEEILGTLSSF